jgi:AraC-like DNA-binding protein
MGESFNASTSLPFPFVLIEERVIYIPKGRSLDVKNESPKLILLLSGSADLFVDGRKLGVVQAGDAIAFPKPCLQRYTPHASGEERMHVIRITIDARVLSDDVEAEEAESNQALAAFIAPLFNEFRIFRKVYGKHLVDWVKTFRSESEKRLAGHGHAIFACCQLITVALARQCVPHSQAAQAVSPRENGSGSPQHPSSWVVEHVKEFITSNHTRPVSLLEIATKVNLSEEHLCRRFKMETGFTVFSFLRKVRMETAKGLLVSSKFSIAQVARKSGFGSPMQFSRAFRETTSTTPKAYRAEATQRIRFQQSLLNPVKQPKYLDI